MKRLLKVLGVVVLLFVAACGGYVGYVSLTWDKDYSTVEKPALRASQDPEVIRRGEYLVHSVAHCSVCHAPLEVTMNRKPGEHPPMTGGFEWKMGPLGTLYSRNITPDPETGIGRWTDEELARALKYAVGRDGKLLPFMSLGMAAMSDEDLQAVISYLRSTAPVKQANRPHQPGLLLKWIATKVTPDFRKGLLQGLQHVPPAEEPSVARGEYLARGPGACVGCHTPFDMMSFTFGGAPFSGSAQPEPDKDNPEMVYRMPNLTPDPKTGHIFTWDEEHFVSRFRAGRALPGSKMPWEAYREMSDADLRGVFRYLKSLPPSVHYIGPSYRKASEDPSKDPAAPQVSSR